MKTFHIAPSSSDYTIDGDSYHTPIYDVYDNEFYRNYCTVRTRYGTNLIGDQTWTGLNVISPTETDSGFIDLTNRFVDTSARVVLHAPVFEMNELADFDGVTATIDVYTSDIIDYPDDWGLYETVEQNQEFTVTNCDRYVRFVVNINNPNNHPIDPMNLPFKMAIRVGVDRPVMTPLYESAKRGLNKLPEWMQMREVDNEPTKFATATPETVGASFYNALVGEWFDRINTSLTYANMQSFIDTVDLNQVAWIKEYDLYRNSNDVDIKWFSRIIDGDTGIELAQAGSLDEFYDAAPTSDIYIWSEGNHMLFTRKTYDELYVVQGAVTNVLSTASDRHVWNSLDDIALLVDLSRHKLESNENFRKRILDVHIHRPGAGMESFKLAIRRELDIWQSYGATPDSDFEGATPEVLEISDIETDSTYVNPDGMPKQKFIQLVEKLAKEYPTTWGRFYWGKSYWDVGGDKFAGYGVLPSQYDATPATNQDNGVGDFDDLYIYRPDQFTGPNQFSVALSVRGKHRTIISDTYPAVSVDLAITGHTELVDYDNPVEEQVVTILVVKDSDYLLSTEVEMSAQSAASMTRPVSSIHQYSNEGYGIVYPFDSNGLINKDLDWYDWVAGDAWDPDSFTPSIEDVEDLIAVLGRHDPITLVTTDEPVYDAVDVFWSNGNFDINENPLEVINYDNLSQLYSTSAAAAPFLYMRSRSTAIDSAIPWSSVTQTQTVTLNGGPDNQQQNYTLRLPSFEWPTNVANGADKTVSIKIFGQDENGDFAASTTDAEGNTVYLPVDYIAIDGNNTWTINEKIITLPADDLSAVELISDDFNREDTSDIGRTSETGITGFPIYGQVLWTQPVDADQLEIQDNELCFPNATGPDYIGRAEVFADVPNAYAGGVNTDDVQAIIKASFDNVDSANYGSLFIRGGGSDGMEVRFTDSDVAIMIDTEYATPITDYYVAATPTSPFDVEVRLYGDLMEVYVDNYMVLDYVYDDTFWTNRLMGVGLVGMATCDSFSIEGPARQFANAVDVELSTEDDTLYPLSTWGWAPFESKYRNGELIAGIVDENGPWRNNVQPSAPSNSYTWSVQNLTRDDFAIPETDDYVPLWIGVRVAYGANKVNAWLDSNIIKPHNPPPGATVDESNYPASAIAEIYDENLAIYGFEPVVIKARLRPETDPHWYPQINSGFFFLENEERYLYANRKDEILESATPTLSNVPRQGAPILVYTTGKQLLSADTFNRADGEVGFTDGDGLHDPTEWNEDYGDGFYIEDSILKTEDGEVCVLTLPDVVVGDFEAVISPLLDNTQEASDLGLPARCLFLFRSDLVNNEFYYVMILEDTTSGATPGIYNEYYFAVGKFYDNAFHNNGYIVMDTFPTTVRVSMIGDTIQGWADGNALEPFVDDTPLAPGPVGFESLGSTILVNDISVYEIDSDYEPIEYRQVSFYDEVNEDLSLVNTETLVGNGTDTLYAAYKDIYDVTVKDLTTEQAITAYADGDSNRVKLNVLSAKNHAYELKYRVHYSFLARPNNDLEQFNPGISLELSELPPGDDILVASYEESIYNPAAVVDLPLSPAYTRIEEGFIFISENEHTLDRVQANISPNKIVANGKDYVMFNIKSLDVYGNPKPAQSFSISTSWGYVSTPMITTNSDGYASFILYASTIPPDPLHCVVTVSGAESIVIDVEVQPVIEPGPTLVAAPSAEEIPANGEGIIAIHGLLLDNEKNPIVGNNITAKRGRTLYEAFVFGEVLDPVTTNDDGVFELAPLTASDEPGFWFVVLENEEGTAGDVIFWHEYAMTAYGVDDMNGLPVSDIQMATPISAIPPYSYDVRFPYAYDEDQELLATPNTVLWLPPKWFGLDWFLQYQLGIISDTDRYELPAGYEDEAHNPYRL